MSLINFHSANSRKTNTALWNSFNAGYRSREQIFEIGDCVVHRFQGHRGVVVDLTPRGRVRVKFDHAEFNVFKHELRPARPEDSPE